MITGIAVPLELAAALCATFAAFGAWAGRHYTLQRMIGHASTAFWEEQPSRTAPVFYLAASRSAVPEVSRSVLLGRVSRISDSAETGSGEILEKLADVMRASLRRDDRLTVAEDETFTLEIDGADESVAASIAQRLRDALARLRFPSGRGEASPSAKFGVAAAPHGIAGDVLIRRAREALGMALRNGEEHIMKTSDMEEIRLLPPPAPTPLASAA